MSWNVLSLFSGIGGLELGLERAGMMTIGQVEIDDQCNKVLAKHWPNVPRHKDVTTAVEWWQSQNRPKVDVVCGGFPCQPVSVSGRGLAQNDERWLWPQMFNVVSNLKPRWVVAENVPGLRTRGLQIVLNDLRECGYITTAGIVSACALGATHTRRRMFIVAHSPGECGQWSEEPAAQQVDDWRRGSSETWRRTDQSSIPRITYGVSRGLDRRKQLGNAVVPAVSEYIGKLVMSS